MQPYNYSMNVGNPANAISSGIMQGVNLATGIEKIKNLQAMKQYQSDMGGIYGEGVDKKAFMNQMLQKYPQFSNETYKTFTIMDQQEQAKNMQNDLVGLANKKNATANDYLQMMAKYPTMSEEFKKSYDILDQAKKDAAVKEASAIYAAINTGNIEQAKKLLTTKIEAATNAGMEDQVASSKALLNQLNIDPSSAKTSAGLFLASAAGADKFPDMFKQITEGSGTYKVLTPGEKAKLGLPTNVPFQISPTGKITEVGSNKINVNVGGKEGPQFGTIPKGFMLKQTADGYVMTPVPGSPAAIEAKNIAEAKTKATEQTATTGGVVIEDLERLKKKIEGSSWYNPVTGVTGSIASYIPGTNRVDAEQLKETIVANIGFDKLQRMREASPTGGALGAVSERELSNLQAVLGNLALSQSDKQLVSNINRLNNLYKKILTKANAYPNATEFGFGTSEEDKKSIYEKYGITE